jgi:hypothetical protein
MYADVIIIGDTPNVERVNPWYPVTVLCIRYNLFAATETLYLFVYEPIAIQILLGGPDLKFGEGL